MAIVDRQGLEVFLEDSQFLAASERVRDALSVTSSSFTSFVTSTSATATQLRHLERATTDVAEKTKPLVRGSDAAQQALFGLGFVVNDAAQFSFGLGQGMRSIANNIGPLIQQVGRVEGGFKSLLSSLAGPAGLILAINAVTTAIVFFSSRTKTATDDVRDLAKEAASAVGQIFSLKEALDVKLVGDIGDATRALRGAERDIAAREAIIAAIRAERPTAEQALAPGTFAREQQRRIEAERVLLRQAEGVRDALRGQLQALEQIRNASQRLAAAGAVPPPQTQRRGPRGERIPAPPFFLGEFAPVPADAVVRPTLRVPPEDVRSVRALAGAYDEAASALAGLRHATEIGLLTPMDAARERVSILERALLDMRAAQEQNTSGFAAMAEQLREAQRELALTHLGFQALSTFAQGLGSDVANLITGFTSLSETLESLGDLLRSVIRDLIAAAARAAIFAGIAAAFGLGSFGSLFLAGLGLGGATARSTSAPVGAPLAVSLSGNLDVGTDRVRFALSENAARARR